MAPSEISEINNRVWTLYRETRGTEKFLVKALLIILILVAPFVMLFYLPRQAADLAEKPLSGEGLSGARIADLGILSAVKYMLPGLGNVPVLGLRAEPSQVLWEGGQLPDVFRARGIECLLYLGESKGTAVFFDPDKGEPIRLPSSKLTIIALHDSPVACKRDTDIRVLDLASGSDVMLPGASLLSEFEPTFSPDGKSIAFTSDRDGDLEIYVMNANGSEVRRLTNSSGPDYEPSWSPTGSSIAFTRARGGNYDIYLMNSDGSGLRRLTNHPLVDASPDWSPDGNRIAFTTARDGDDAGEIYLMNTFGEELVRLTSHRGPDLGPVWSPDGSRVAFSAGGRTKDRFDLDIYTVAVGTGKATRITSNSRSERVSAWSPDGTQLLATRVAGDGYQMTLFGTNGDTSRVLSGILPIEPRPTFSPDGAIVYDAP